MLTTIVVPLDGSDLAERALPYAVALATPARTWVILQRVIFADDLRRSPDAERDAQKETDAAADRLRGHHFPVESCVSHADYGDPGQTIAEAARRWQADLIVMATHARSDLGRWLRGSVADEVLRLADVPVLMIPQAAHATWSGPRPSHILVPLDGSKLSEAALETAAQLAEARQAELTLLRVVELPPYAQLVPEPALAAVRQELEAAAVPLREAGRQVQVRAEPGSAAAVINTVAREVAADLIVMATHGRGGLARAVLGSIATATLQGANLPLLLVPPIGVHGAANPS